MGTTIKKYKKGQTIFFEGDTPKSLFLIKDGVVAIQKRKGNQVIELSRLHSNEVLGELAFFDRANRSATAVAMTDVELHEIDFYDLQKMYEKIPDYIKRIIVNIVERLRKSNNIIKKLQKDGDLIATEVDEFISSQEADSNQSETKKKES